MQRPASRERGERGTAERRRSHQATTPVREPVPSLPHTSTSTTSYQYQYYLIPVLHHTCTNTTSYQYEYYLLPGPCYLVPVLSYQYQCYLIPVPVLPHTSTSTTSNHCYLIPVLPHTSTSKSTSTTSPDVCTVCFLLRVLGVCCV